MQEDARVWVVQLGAEEVAEPGQSLCPSFHPRKSGLGDLTLGLLPGSPVVARKDHGSPVLVVLWPGCAGLGLGPGPAVVVGFPPVPVTVSSSCPE